MQALLDFLLKYGYWVLFANVLAEQLAIPLPATPVLLAMGALAGLGHFSWLASLAIASAACLACDQIWYRLGRKRGLSILRLVCKMSLEPDSCVSSTKASFAKWGAWSLVAAKFVPGLSAVAAPLAGLTRMPAARFLAADFAGSVLWSGAYLALGFLFRNQLEEGAQAAARFGGWMAAAAGLAVGAYFGYKFSQRRRFLRGLEISRIQPEELRGMMESGANPVVVDLRHVIELSSSGVKVPGAIQAGEGIEKAAAYFPSGRDVVLYCS